MIAELRAVVDAIADQDEERAFSASVEHVMAASAIAIEHLTNPVEAS
jgi:DNA-binding FadR family transcriptional regulator